MPLGVRHAGLTHRLTIALLVATLGVACASSDAGTSVATTETSAPLESTVPPATTTSPPTVPATEPVVTTAPTTSVAIDEGFRPPCVESQRADRSAVSLDE